MPTADPITSIPAASMAAVAGESAPTVAEQIARQTQTPPAPSTPASAFSSEAGAAALTKSTQTAAQLAGQPYNGTNGALTAPNGQGIAAPAGAKQSTNGLWYDSNGKSYSVAPKSDGSQNFESGDDTAQSKSTTTMVNPKTGQEYTLTNPSAEQIANFKANGWDISEGTGDGKGVIPDNTDPQVKAAQDATDQAKADRDSAVAKLTTFNVSNDPALTSLLSSITTQWDQRIADMDRANRSRIGNTTTLGIRLGDRYTGGTGGMFGGIISEEETQGVNRIADLESQKQQALAAATKAYSDQQWERYSKLVDIAETAYKDQQTSLSKLQTDAITQSKTLQEAITKANEDHYTQVTKPINDLADSVLKNTGDSKLAASVKAAPDLGSAMALAGDSVQTGTGIVGEYLFYKRQAQQAGQIPVDFSTYQTVDANRKAKATASAGGTGSVDLTTFDTKTQKSLTDSGFTKYNGGTQDLAVQLVTGGIAPSELSKRTTGSSSYNDVLTAANLYSKATTGKPFSIAQADRDYKFAQRPQTQDTLNYLGSLVGSDDGSGNISGGNLDDLVSLSNGLTRTSFPAINDIAGWARYSTGDPKIAAFQATATEVADQVAKILQGGGSGGTSDAKLQQAANLFNTGFTKDQMIATVNALKPLLANRAKSMIKDNPYLSDYADQFGIKQNIAGKQPSTASTIQTQETTAQGSIKNYVTAHPEAKETVKGHFDTMESTLGRSITAAEFLQAFPEYAQ